MSLEQRALLMVGETFHTPNLFYKIQYVFADPVIYLEKAVGQSLLVCADFGCEHVARVSKVSQVHGFSHYTSGHADTHATEYEQIAHTALQVLRAEDITQVVTTNDMPLWVADYLRTHGIDLLCVPDVLLQQRETKQEAEREKIEYVQQAAERAMQQAITLIANASVGADGMLYDGTEVITSERVRAVILNALYRDRCTADKGIYVSSGLESAYPSNPGHGPLQAHQPIILDIYPRHEDSRYYADMTRTVSKGTPLQTILHMYEATQEALKQASASLRPGKNGREVFEQVCALYEERGYATYIRNGRYPQQGFMHSLGHGVGLDVHEAPKLGPNDSWLQEGHVVTIEPGLYLPGIGGVRLEDLISITATGSESLTHFPTTLVL